jgi:hypothetical protein
MPEDGPAFIYQRQGGTPLVDRFFDITAIFSPHIQKKDFFERDFRTPGDAVNFRNIVRVRFLMQCQQTTIQVLSFRASMKGEDYLLMGLIGGNGIPDIGCKTTADGNPDLLMRSACLMCFHFS